MDTFMQADSYGESDICNCYYDTPSYRMIRKSLEKDIYKEKLRVRSYGTPLNDDEKVFLELKKKYDGIIYKRRERLSYRDIKEAISVSNANRESKNVFGDLGYDSQIFRELDWVINFYQELQPVMYLYYQRIALIPKETSGLAVEQLRITFDRNLRWRTSNVDLSAGTRGENLLEDGQRIMEIKTPGAMPLWLAQLLNELKIYPTSYSKYGRAYEQYLKLKQDI